MRNTILTIAMVALTFGMNAQNNAVGIWEGETIRNGDISNNIS